MAPKIIAVVGATGGQGGGLARAILEDRSGGFAVRALTRDPKGAKARELAKMGAQVVPADVDDPASLTRAFHGCHGAFCVTPFWAHMSPDKEIAEAGALARAAKEAGVAHAIWSTLEDTRKRVPLADDRMPTIGGRWKVPHFDAKGESDETFRSLAVPTTFLLTSFYWDNLIHFGMGPKKSPDGRLAFVLPMADRKLPGIAVEDIGRCAYGVFRRGKDLVGKTVGVAGEHLTGEQMAAALSKAMGREIVYQYVPPEVYRTFGFPGADDLANMFQYKRDFEREFCAARDLAFSRSVNPRLQTFAEWLAKNAAAIPIG